MDNNPKTNAKPEHTTFGFIKDFSKVLVLDGREKVAEGIYNVADFVDTTQEQKNWSRSKKAEFERLRKEKELAAQKTVPAGAKA
jgi:hypothetical protein